MSINGKESAAESAEQAVRRATFREACKGLDAYRVSRACNLLTPGLNWRGLPKSRPCEEFVKGDLSAMTGQDLRNAIAKEGCS